MRSHRGFGLIELLVGVAIIAALIYCMMRMHGARRAGMEGKRYDQIYNEARKTIEGVVNKQESGGGLE